MATRVFISWSGDLSRDLGEELRVWLPSVLQNVRPYFSPEDIEKGAKWDSSIAAELELSDIGIICLTADNTDKPWILFEAGALSKSIKNGRVCTVLFGLDPSQVKGPLLNFQATQFKQDDVRSLIKTINGAAGDDALDSQVLERVFEMWWPELDSKVGEILSRHATKQPAPKARAEKDILEEVLELSRLAAAKTHIPRSLAVPALDELLVGIGEALSFMPDEVVPMVIENLERALLQLARESDLPPSFVFDRVQRWMPHSERARLSGGRKGTRPDSPRDVRG